MKKISMIALTIVLVLSGCTQTSQVEEETIKLTVWHYYGGTAQETFAYLVRNFNQTVGAELGIEVEAYGYNNVTALAEAVEASANGVTGAAKMPAIFASYADSVLPLEDAGLIANLDDYFTEDELNTYYGDFIEEGRLGSDEELIILPIAKSTEVLHINQTAFDTFAQSTGYTYDDLQTWEGLAEVSEAYYHWSDAQTLVPDDGKAFFGTDGMANFMILGTKQLGYDIFLQEDGQIKHQFTQEVAQKFWDVFYVPYIQGYFSAQATYRSDDVTSGEIVAYVGSTASSYYFPSQAQYLNGTYVDIACKTLPYPTFAEGDLVAVQQGAGMVVSESTPEREEAATVFLKWFTQAENNCGFAVSTGYMPVKDEVLSAEVILAEMGRDGLVDEGMPIVQATNTTYQQLETYDLYTSIPFTGSDDARVILEYSLPNKIASDQEVYEARVLEGEDGSAVMAELMSDANFQQWYEEISAQLDATIAP